MVISKVGFLYVNSRLTREDVRNLAGLQAGWCLSLFLPLGRDGRDADQGQLLLRDLGRKARRELALRGASSRVIESILAPVERLEENDIRLCRAEGLAVFSSQGGSACFLLPEAPAERMEIDLRFRLEPLVPILAEEDGFFLLTLGLHGARLWKGNRLELQPVHLAGAHLHPPRTPLHDKSAAAAFCREVDQAVLHATQGSKWPLILAGSHPILALFRKASGNPMILDDSILGDPESESIGHGMHAQAWDILKDARRREIGAALREYRERLAGPGTASGIADVLACAQSGIVRHLFLRKGYAEWGSLEAGTGRITLVPVPTPITEDLANRACLDTLLHGGRVHVLAENEMPPDTGIAALCRF
jgi:hypothetical protein